MVVPREQGWAKGSKNTRVSRAWRGPGGTGLCLVRGSGSFKPELPVVSRVWNFFHVSSFFLGVEAFAHSRLTWRQWAVATSGGGSPAVSGEQLPKCILTTCHRSTSRNSTSHAVSLYFRNVIFTGLYFLMKLLVILALYPPKQLGISTGISSLKLLPRK